MKVFIVVPSSIGTAASSLSCSHLAANRGVDFVLSLVITGLMSLSFLQQRRHKHFSFMHPLTIALRFCRNVCSAFRQSPYGGDFCEEHGRWCC